MNCSNPEDTNVVLLPHCELPRESRAPTCLLLVEVAMIPSRAVAAALQPSPQLVVVHVRTER